MPAKKGNGNGPGICRAHPKAGPACRRCLVDGLGNLRIASVRSGIAVAIKRVERLRAKYASANGVQVRAVDIRTALTTLVGELEAARDRVGDLPTPRGMMLEASNRATAGLS